MSEESGQPKKRNGRRLLTVKHVRLEMAELYRMVSRGDMESGEANRRTWLLRQVADLIVSSDIEVRLQALEKGIGGQT